VRSVARLMSAASSLVLYFGRTRQLSTEIFRRFGETGVHEGKPLVSEDKVKSHEIPSRKISDLTIAVSSNGGSNC